MKVTLVGAGSSQPTLNKAFSPTLNNMDLVKAMPAADMKAWNENPLRLAEAANYKDKPSSLSYNILYQMSVKNSVVSAVLNTRINQVSTFTKPARFSTDGVGFQIRLRDPKAVPTSEQQEVITALELFLENCGFTDASDRDDFDTFIRKLVRDSLTYDQMCFEIIPDRKGKPSEIVAVDAATIRAASENYTPEASWSVEAPKKGEEVKWVQVVDGSVVSWFTAKELAFGVRNPRTNINMQPYGFSELEMLIQQITSHLYAEEYNAKYFSQGGTTKGIINIKSDPNGIGNKEQLESFKRQWRAQVNGMSGAWKTPVLQVPNGIEYISVNQSNRDMEYSQWVNYLINIVCAVYQIDPAEVNFSNNGGAAAQSSVFESSQEQKLKNSKDKGLKPLLRFIESIINKFVVSKFSQEYVFVFTGLDEKSESEKADLDTKQVKTWRTINEIRKEHGEKPLENGDVILDPSYLNYIQQKEMASQGGGMGTPMSDGTEDVPDEEQSDDYSDYDSEETNDDSQETSDEQEEPQVDDYSEYEVNSGEEKAEKSLSKLIISLEE
nr:MAG TPA: Portal protein [Herelleviridae sp.]